MYQPTGAEQRFRWWTEARFGLFIHWGLYAIPAGEWRGEMVPGLGEWIMRNARIPVREYEQLAKVFNPIQFDAEQWVQLAKDAGMKYIVITAKHHDGFAMFHSQCSPYNIVDATPFKRDPMKELAEACQKEGIRLCFYYSQALDWHHPDAAMNDWDYPDEDQKDFARYFAEKCKPQVRELLTRYGPIGLIWFDMPRVITEAQSQELINLVHDLQPNCLVNSRVGHGLGDYRSSGDNQIPVVVSQALWETPATLNSTWGYRKDDRKWKPVDVLVQLLSDIVGKGGNYLLNVGPTAEGRIPAQSVDHLREIGEWLSVNGEAVYGTKPSPFAGELAFGAVTQKPGRLYLHVFDWQESLILHGLDSTVHRAYLLADRERSLKVHQYSHSKTHASVLEIELPTRPPTKYVSVVVLEIGEEPQVDPRILQQPSGKVVLEASLSQIHRMEQESGLGLDRTGATENWENRSDSLSWDFTLLEPGVFSVEVWSAPASHAGHEISISIAGMTLDCEITEQEKLAAVRSPHARLVVTTGGSITLAKAGTYTLEVRVSPTTPDRRLRARLRAVHLVPGQ